MTALWVLDTHLWIRLMTKDPALSRPEFLKQLDGVGQARGLRLAAITLWETAMLAAKGRIKLERPVLDWVQQALSLPGLEVEPLGPEIAVDSCFLPGEFHGDPADRQIVATARRLGAVLVTLDQAIWDYGRKGYVAVLNPLAL